MHISMGFISRLHQARGVGRGVASRVRSPMAHAPGDSKVSGWFTRTTQFSLLPY